MLCALLAPMPYVPPSYTWLLPYVFLWLRCLVPYVPSCLTCLVFYVLFCFMCLVPYMLWRLTCLKCFFTSRVLCLACCCLLVPHALRARASSFTWLRCFKPNILIYISRLVAFMSCASCAFGGWAIWAFKAWAEVSHCDTPFTKNERHYKGFLYKCLSLQDPLTLLHQLTTLHFIPLVSFYSPWEHQGTS